MLIITYRFCAEGAYYGAAGENFAGFCGREGKFCGFHGLHHLLRMQLLTPGPLPACRFLALGMLLGSIGTS